MKKEYLYMGTTILLWGLSATVSKLFFSGLNTYYILAMTGVFSWLMLLAGTFLTGTIKELKKVSLKTMALMVAVGSLGVFFCNYFYQKGISLLPAQQAFVINYLWPTFVIIFSVPILHEKLTVTKLFAILLAFLGVVCVATNGNISSLFGGALHGILMSVLGAVFYGLYSPLNKRFDYDKELALMLTYFFTTILAFVMTAFDHGMVMPTLRQFFGIVIFGAFINGIGYLTFAKAMQIGNTAVMSNLSYLTPVVSLFVTHFVLGDEITFYSIIGLVLILMGVVIQILNSKEKERV